MELLPQGAKPGPSTNSNKRLKSENILGFHCHAIKNKIVKPFNTESPESRK